MYSSNTVGIVQMTFWGTLPSNIPFKITGQEDCVTWPTLPARNRVAPSQTKVPLVKEKKEQEQKEC